MRGVVRMRPARAWTSSAFSAEVDGVSHALTHKECAVLRSWPVASAEAVSRDEILDRACRRTSSPLRAPSIISSWARKLIEPDANEPRLIRSIRGVGYLLTEVLHD